MRECNEDKIESIHIFIEYVIMSLIEVIQQWQPQGFSVCSYNILAAPLANEEFYTQASPLSLDPDYRYEMLTTALEILIYNQTIIALQEVSRGWSSLLVPFFLERGYIVLSSQENNERSDYAGVFLALPVSTQPSHYYVNLRDLLNELTYESDELYQEVIRDISTGMIVAIMPDGLVVATTHLPSRFGNPYAMKKYAEAIIKHLSIYSEVILLGDFNTLPGSEVYKLFSQHFLSAYYTVQGKEPEFTNSSITLYTPRGWKGTIDYIWYRGNFDPSQLVPSLPFDYYPNEQNPSDHIPIGCVF